jgi:hypothetical protein
MKILSRIRESGSRRRGAVFIVGGFLVAVFLVACLSSKIPTTYTPPAATIIGDPWNAAERISTRIPNSQVTIGHGDSMLPFYPNGTVLVLQRLDWIHLREGMTVVYLQDVSNRFSMAGGVLVKQEDDHWFTSGTDSDAMDVNVHASNYVGTVVAAFRNAEPQTSDALIRAIPKNEAATCLMRCHIP